MNVLEFVDFVSSHLIKAFAHLFWRHFQNSIMENFRKWVHIGTYLILLFFQKNKIIQLQKRFLNFLEICLS